MEGDDSRKRKQERSDESHKKKRIDDSEEEADDRVPLDDNASSTQCIICLDTLNDSGPEYLPCTHCFHAMCITRWLRRNSTCPICRTPITNRGNLQVGSPTVGATGIPFEIMGLEQDGGNEELRRIQAESRRLNEEIRRTDEEIMRLRTLNEEARRQDEDLTRRVTEILRLCLELETDGEDE